MNFVAQFCFADSRDITPALPGDLLLIFAEGRQWGNDPEDCYLMLSSSYDSSSETAFEWVSLGDFPLTTKAEIPKTPFQIMPCYGTIYRTWDYPTIDGFAYRHIAEHITPIMAATKIGGIPPWIQPEEDIPGTFLCSLESTDPEISKPYPFLNVPETITYEEWENSRALLIGDVGTMYFFINSYGDLRWTTQSG